MSFKSRFLEDECKRLRADNRLLLSALLERAGHAQAAAILRMVPEPVVAGPEGVKIASEPETITGRGWRSVRKWWQEQMELPPDDSQENRNAQ